MVKTGAPILSVQAAGGLGSTLVFSQSKGRVYARKPGKSTKAPTASQIGSRAITQFLTQAWKTLTTEQQASYAPLATPEDIAPYHAFLRYNLKRWARGAAPSQAYPATQLSTPTDLDSAEPVPDTPRTWGITITNTSPNRWAQAIYDTGLSEDAPTAHHLIKIVPMPLNTVTYWASPATPGVHNLWFATLADDGVLTPPIGYVAVTVLP